MHVLTVRDVNEALPRALAYLRDCGKPEQTRNGPALVAPGPVATVYREPQRRVLFDAERDANPFFHLFESLWILAGRRDVRFLSWFNSRIADYSDDGKVFHAPYGFRLRHAFNGTDQLQAVARQLRTDPNSRRAVLQIWNAGLDLNVTSKDLPCNLMVLPRVRDGVLDITVCNRSNDAVWGAYGANAVQFSFIQEYLAHMIGCGIGEYTQMSHNLHVYTDNPYWQAWRAEQPAGVHVPECPYDDHGEDGFGPDPSPLIVEGESIEQFDNDLADFFRETEYGHMASANDLDRAIKEGKIEFSTKFFKWIVIPMLDAFVHRSWRDLDIDYDWHAAGSEWVLRRFAKKVTP